MPMLLSAIEDAGRRCSSPDSSSNLAYSGWRETRSARCHCGHVVLYSVLSDTALSTAVVSGVILLVVIKHLGLLAPLYAFFRRRFGH